MIDYGNEFGMLPGDTLAGIVERYEQVAARTATVVGGLPDLSATQPLPAAPWQEPGAAYSVRRVLMHLIMETAQHAGHADMLRESLDSGPRAEARAEEGAGEGPR